MHTDTQLPFICQDPAADGDTVWTLTQRFLTFFLGVSYSPTQTDAWLRFSLLSGQQVTVTEGVWASLSHTNRLLLSSLGTVSLFSTALHCLSFPTVYYTNHSLHAGAVSLLGLFGCLWWVLYGQVHSLMQKSSKQQWYISIYWTKWSLEKLSHAYNTFLSEPLSTQRRWLIQMKWISSKDC